jgi:preprotein translocase subunit SecA
LRDQILDRANLREKILTEHLPAAVATLVDTYCVADYHDEWDVTGLHAEMLTYWPTSLTLEDLAESTSRRELTEVLTDDGIAHYEKREEELGAEVLRQVERQVMLRIIDTRWREHLYEMDYLQEGINLRAMGQRDPLTEWQREGFEMFGQMMQGIAQDLLRYVMHVQVEVSEPAQAQAAALAAKAKEEAEAAAAAVAAIADAPKVALDWNAPTDEATGEAAEATESTDEVTTDEATTDETATDEAATDEATGDEAATPDDTTTPDEPATDEAASDDTATPDEAAPADEATAGATDDAPDASEAAFDAAPAAEEPSTDEVVATIAGIDAEVQILGYSMPDDPSSGGGMAAAATQTDTSAPPAAAAAASADDTMVPVRKTEWEKTARNAPCPCGSGKKYKRCHGDAA